MDNKKALHRYLYLVGIAVAIASFALTSCGIGSLPTPTLTPTITLTPTEIPTATATPTPLAENILWEQSCGKIQLLTKIGDGNINQIRFFSDNNTVAIAAGGGVGLYDIANLKLLWFAQTESEITQVEQFSDTRLIAVDRANRLLQFDLASGKIVDSADPRDVMTSALSSDGSLLLIVDWFGSFHIYKTDDVQEIATNEDYIQSAGGNTLSFKDLVYNAVAISPDNKYVVTAAYSGRISIYDASQGALVSTYENPSDDFPKRLSISADGSTIAVEMVRDGSESYVSVLNIFRGFLNTEIEGTSPILSPDGQSAYIETEHEIQLWRLQGKKLLVTYPVEDEIIPSLGLSDDGKIVAATVIGVKVWELSTGALIGSLPGNYSSYQQAIALDEKTIIARTDRTVKFLNIESAEISRRIPFDELISTIAINPTGDILAIVSNGSISVWNIADESLLFELPNTYGVQWVAFFPNNDIFTLVQPSSFLEETKAYNLSIGNELYKIAPLNKAVAATRSGKFIGLVTVAAGIEMRDLESGILAKTLKKNEQGLDSLSFSANALAFSPQEEVIAIARSEPLKEQLQLLDQNGHEVCTIKTGLSMQSLSFGLRGNKIFSAGSNGIIYVWGMP